MKYLVKACFDRLSDLFPPETNSKVYFNSAHSDATVPFKSFTVEPSDEPAYQTDADEITESVPVMFHAYNHSSEDAYDDIKTIEQSFANTALVLKSGTLLATYIGGHLVEEDPDRDSDGKEVWHGVLTIDFMVQRSLKSA